MRKTTGSLRIIEKYKDNTRCTYLDHSMFHVKLKIQKMTFEVA